MRGSFFQRIGHAGNIGVESGANILNIEDQRVDALEHFIGWTARIAVQAVNRQASRGILRGDHVFVGAAGEPVLGAEQRDELHARCVRQQVDVAAAERIQTRMIGNQPDVFAAERRKPFRFENVKPSLDPRSVTGAYRSVWRKTAWGKRKAQAKQTIECIERVS